MRPSDERLDIADASVDLVTSSMVLSQFEHEPYDYLAHQAAERIGPPRPRDEKKLRPVLESLRGTLVAGQVERHLDEIARILAPDGRCFMSFELFHFDPAVDRWFMVREMHDALARITQRFRFDFDTAPAEDGVMRFENRGRHSLVHSFLLAPA